MKTKNTKNFHINQDKYKIILCPSEEFIKYPVNSCWRLKHSRKAVLNYLIFIIINCKEAFPSHKAIAKATKYSVSTVKRAIKELVELKLIHSIYCHMESNVYKVADMFFNLTLAKELKAIFSALASLLIVAWMPGLTGNIATNRNELQLNNILGSYKDLSLSSCSSRLSTVDKLTNCKSRQPILQINNHKIQVEQKRTRSSMATDEKVLKYLCEIPGLNRAGITQLSAFPLLVLKTAFNGLKIRPDIAENPYYWVRKQCFDLCRKNNLKSPELLRTAQQPYLDNEMFREAFSKSTALTSTPTSTSTKEKTQETSIPTKGRTTYTCSAVAMVAKLNDFLDPKFIDAQKNLMTGTLFTKDQIVELWKKAITEVVTANYDVTNEQGEKEAIALLESWRDRLDDIDDIANKYFNSENTTITMPTTTNNCPYSQEYLHNLVDWLNKNPQFKDDHRIIKLYDKYLDLTVIPITLKITLATNEKKLDDEVVVDNVNRLT